MRLLISAITVSLALAAVPALAQQATGSGTGSWALTKPGGAQHAVTGLQAQQAMRQQLEKNGYTDVRIVPEAFVVHAKDPQGNPIAMMITPDQVTGVVEESGTSSQPDASGAAARGGRSGFGTQQ